MIVGSVCMSHSPLKDSNRPPPETEARFCASLHEAADRVAELKPDVAVIFYPDHQNGFFYRMLPSFCVVLQGDSVGDYGTAAGKLDIPESRATDLARSVLDSGVDVAIAYEMQIDHGAVQPLEWLSERHPPFPIIPVFVNCAAAPLPSFERVRALGKAVGDWAREAPERVLIIGSGGLSHDPPLPSIATATPEIRKRIVSGEPLEHSKRFMRQNRARIEGNAMAAGQSSLLSVNSQWDRKILDALVAGNLSILDGTTDAALAQEGGRGSHEVRTWIAALAALGPSYSADELFYEPINEWITGMGILVASEA